MLEEITDNNTDTPNEAVVMVNETAITVSRKVTDEDAEVLWQMIQSGFVDLNRRSYENQAMTYEEFTNDMQSDGVLKFTSRNHAGDLIGCMTVHEGLDDVPWVENTWSRDEQARIDPNTTSYYIGTLVVPVDLRGTEAATRLLQGALSYFKSLNMESGHDSLCFFDCADANDPWLAEFARSCASPSEGFKGVPLDIYEIGQEWWVKQSDGTVQKIVAPEEYAVANQAEVIDKQHYYALKLKSE